MHDEFQWADADTVPWSCHVGGQSPAIAAQVQGRSPPPTRFPAMGCSGSIQSIEYTTTLSPCKGKELQVVEKGSKKVTAKSGLKHVWCFVIPECNVFPLSPIVQGGIIRYILQVEASNQVSFGCKKVSFDSIQMHEVEVEDERKRLKEANSPEASLQRFLEMIDANGVILEEKVSRKRRRDFGLLESEACLAESSMWKYRETCEASESPTGEPAAIFRFYGPCVAWMACEGTCWSASHWPYSLNIYCSLLSTLVGAWLKTTWVCIVCTSHVPPVERFFPCTIIWSFHEFSAFSHRREVEYAVCSVGKLAFGSVQIFNSGDLWGVCWRIMSPSWVYMGGPASRGSWGTQKAVPGRSGMIICFPPRGYPSPKNHTLW